MTFEKECSITMMFAALVLAFVCGILYYRLEDNKEQLRFLELEVKQLRIEHGID